ncbi:hypothetical protein BCR36DRAFT_298241 [Piromyces finnis]|uniref:Uncharacterized protein n=1 Tax=Piromyces finnis TaxID=1754191 RepID=A0A1Y1V3P3_9FUNG|nr:hypothetical protein BCR36DRAFT_298241 [Piromyces finnis]|eukprot:ORX45958.1 hypothetical protein BCR36DRAFT_298241 [Piromyces finnis]
MNFDFFCNKVSLPMCSLVDSKFMPECYSRNLEIVKGHLTFQGATLFMGIVALVMTLIMIFHIKSKYTAVGRKEVVIFYYLYFLYIILEMVVSSGVVPLYLEYYKYVVASYIGVVGAACTTLLVSGLVSFQWIEDGTAKSLWLVRVCALISFGINFAVSYLTFEKQILTTSQILYILFFIVNGAEILIYFLLQVFLVITVLDEKWPLGAILFAAAFYIIGIVCEFVFSKEICGMCAHYIDGVFFGVTFILLAVMMVYKYWDSITKEDLEFSVGKNQTVWEIKEPTYYVNDKGPRPF